MEPAISPESTPAPNPIDRQQIMALNRFVATLAGAFRAFYLYKHDNKAIDEIMNNLSKRFKLASRSNSILKFGITNISLTFNGNPVGPPELTTHLASHLRQMGFKEIEFTSPLQSHHFYPFLNILTGKDQRDVLLDKLSNFFKDGSPKPIALVPITANSLILRLGDDFIAKQLDQLKKPKEEGGSGFYEALNASEIDSIPDLFTWICIKAQMLPDDVRAFVRNIADAAREGFFPFHRFLRVFPLPPDLAEKLDTLSTQQPQPRSRRRTWLGHRFIPEGKNQNPEGFDWVSYLCSFTDDEVKTRQQMRYASSQNNYLQDLELAQSLVRAKGAHFSMGVRLLLRVLGNKNTVAIQEKALKVAIGVWVQSQQMDSDPKRMSLLSNLRQTLCETHNMTVLLSPLRNLTMESEMFVRMAQFIASLGESAYPALIQALEAEEERSMRKKLCHLLTEISKEHGADYLIEAIPNASQFLLRNIIMILGDAHHADAVEAMTEHLRDPKKIVQVEVIRSLIKIGNDQTSQILTHALTVVKSDEAKKMILDYFCQKKEKNHVPTLIRLAKDTASSVELKRAIYRALATLGGLQAKQFLESLVKESSFFDRFNTTEKETQALIKNLLGRIAG